MKRCRRPLILIALLLLAGAVVNVAVAWSVAAQWQGDGQLDELKSAPQWFVLCKNDAMSSSIDDRESPSMIFFHKRSLAIASAQRFDSPLPGSLYGQETLAAGFPLLALRAVEPPAGAAVSAIKRGWPVGVVHVRGLRLLLYFRGRLPIDPIWYGFAINTLFYTALLALPLSVFPIRRRLREGGRARRGRCPNCGYDLAGLGGADRGGEGGAPCPECGATGCRCGRALAIPWGTSGGPGRKHRPRRRARLTRGRLNGP